MVRLASLGRVHFFGFVFELVHGAFLLVEVTTEAQANRLEEATAFLEGIQALNLYHGTDWRYGLVHRNGDLASRNPALLFMEQTDFHAPFSLIPLTTAETVAWNLCLSWSPPVEGLPGV